ncbi:MAG: ATP-binding cassette domain-containing protein [Deltaproteobacteria bacterium]|nr:ATP-binding cassette domain-containing protein [Deltaproteobacteria bacterium]
MNDVLLAVDKLIKYFPVRAGLIFDRTKGYIKAVDGVSFDVHNGQTFGLVGESGCGKTTIAKLLLLLEPLTSGSILFKHKSITDMNREELREYQFSIQAVFQDPYSSLSPRMRARDIISEPMSTAGGFSKTDKNDRVKELLEIVGLLPESAAMYPHEFSGGQRQRVAVARALAVNPRIIILDEPVSALDVSLQAQILNLLEAIQEKFGITYLIISHDLAVVEHIGDTIGVMYLGQIVESAPADSLYTEAQHPYTQALLSAVPIPDPEVEITEEILGGEVPSPLNPPRGCRFHPRCSQAKEICAQVEPELKEIGPGHKVACHI